MKTVQKRNFQKTQKRKNAFFFRKNACSERAGAAARAQLHLQVADVKDQAALLAHDPDLPGFDVGLALAAGQSLRSLDLVAVSVPKADVPRVQLALQERGALSGLFEAALPFVLHVGPAQRQTKTVVFTYYDGHAFFYRNARPVLEQMGCALVMHRRDPKQTVPPLEEWSPWWGEIKPGHFHTTDLREMRRQLLLAEHNPQVTLRSLAQFSSLKLRAKGGQCVIRELPEDWELLQAWAKGWGCTTAGRGWPR